MAASAQSLHPSSGGKRIAIDGKALRRMVLNKLRAYEDPSGKKPSVRMKRKKCGWSFEYFLKVLMA